MAHARLSVPLVLSLLVAACGGGGGGATNTPPVADAGPAQRVLHGVLVVLDGSASRDAEADPLAYRWTLTARPAGSAAVLAGAGAHPTFTADAAGTYGVTLVVNDGKADSAPATVEVTALAGGSRLHDTGVTACYDGSAAIPCPASGAPFFGQDATLRSNPLRFGDDGTTVADALTGLTWTKAEVASGANWWQASGTYDATYNPTSQDACGALSLGGFGDWRLPSIRELWEVADLSLGRPAEAFSSAGTLWSSTRLGNPAGPNVWVMAGEVLNGAMGFQDGLAAPYSVRCVRGAAPGVNAFADQGNGTVIDGATGLQWQQGGDGVARTWQQALAACEALSLAGLDDWRLPDAKELASLVVLHAEGYATPRAAALTFSTDGNGQSFYWSSTTSHANSAAALGVDFFDGGLGTGGFGKNAFKFARCVR